MKHTSEDFLIHFTSIVATGKWLPITRGQQITLCFTLEILRNLRGRGLIEILNATIFVKLGRHYVK